VQPLPNERPDHSLLEVLQQAIPLLDVRAPVEFERGALPDSSNLPILNDEERQSVGTTYKHSGKQAAQALGHKLVSGQIKAERVAGWRAFVRGHPNARVMCWRGGQRSQLAQQWLAAEGVEAERIPGGYKALRQTCMATLEQAPAAGKDWWVVAGRTGVQKTVLINQLTNSIDLERLAHHRGSAFGAHSQAQPCPASFENSLACAFLRHSHRMLVLEDESRTIGRLALPANWHAQMQQAPLVLLEADVQQRVQHIAAEYVSDALAAGPAVWAACCLRRSTPCSTQPSQAAAPTRRGLKPCCAATTTPCTTFS
jgi:tRNA 2-selenouridine synthase